MNRRFSVLVLLGISLFLLLSAVSAEDIGSDDSNADFDVFNEDLSVENSDDSNHGRNLICSIPTKSNWRLPRSAGPMMTCPTWAERTPLNSA